MHSNHRQDANSALPDIARDAVQALKDHLPYSYQNIKVTARDGWITLEERAAWSAPGIKKVVDQITIQP